MYVRVNAAMSVDGKLSTYRRERLEISGPNDFERVERLRTSVDGILLGVGTVVADDPHLVLDRDRQRQRRDRGDEPSPVRIVADSRARMPPDARILDDKARTIVLVGGSAPNGRVSRLETVGATVIRVGGSRVPLGAAVDRLAEEGIDRLLIEGGGEIIFSAFDAGVVDELTVYVGSMIVGGRDAPTLADGDGFVGEFPDLHLDDVERIDDGVLLTYTVE